MLDHSFVDPLVASADKYHASMIARQSGRLRLREDTSLGREQDDRGRFPGFALRQQRFDAAKDRIRLEHHAVAAPEGTTVHHVMPVVCKRT